MIQSVLRLAIQNRVAGEGAVSLAGAGAPSVAAVGNYLSGTASRLFGDPLIAMSANGLATPASLQLPLGPAIGAAAISAAAAAVRGLNAAPGSAGPSMALQVPQQALSMAAQASSTDTSSLSLTAVDVTAVSYGQLLQQCRGQAVLSGNAQAKAQSGCLASGVSDFRLTNAQTGEEASINNLVAPVVFTLPLAINAGSLCTALHLAYPHSARSRLGECDGGRFVVHLLGHEQQCLVD